MKTTVIALLIMLFSSGINAQFNTTLNADIGQSLLAGSKEHASPFFQSTLKNNREPLDLSYGEGTSATLKSLIVPGWGLHTAVNPENSKRLFLLAPVCYGTVGFGIYSRIRGKKMYDRYLNTTESSKIGEYYDEASKSFRNSIIFTSVGAALWVGQAILTYIYGKRNDDYRDRFELWENNGNTSLRVSPEYDPISNSVMVRPSLTIKLK